MLFVQSVAELIWKPRTIFSLSIYIGFLTLCKLHTISGHNLGIHTLIIAFLFPSLRWNEKFFINITF